MEQKIVVVGCGAWGKNLVRTFADLGALGWIVDRDQGRRCALALQYGVRSYGSLDLALGDKAIRGVVIATPAASHAALTMRALRAGKDVLVEKPMALDRRDADTMVEMAQLYGAMLMVGHIMEYHPAFQAILRLQQGGGLGPLRYITAARLNQGRWRDGEHVMWSFMPHDIAMILRLMGGELPEAVALHDSKYLQGSLGDRAVLHMRFSSGTVATVEASWIHPCKRRELVVVGEHGSVAFDDVTGRILRWETWDQWPGEGNRTLGEVEVPYRKDEPLLLECEAFLASMETREAPLADGVSGRKVVSVLAAADRSRRAAGGMTEF